MYNGFEHWNCRKVHNMSDKDKIIRPSTPTPGKPSQAPKPTPQTPKGILNESEQRGIVELTGNTLPPRKPGQK